MNSGASSLDPSVLVRLLVGDPKDQYESATRFLNEEISANRPVHVSALVLAEAYFALQSDYGIPKRNALGMLALFLGKSGVTMPRTATTVLAISHLANSKPGFVDRLIQGHS
jgi:predicted nucleic-acid-binding protein